MGNLRLFILNPCKKLLVLMVNQFFDFDYELEQMDVLPQEDYFKNTPISIFTSDVSSLSSLYQTSYCDKVEKYNYL